MSQSHFLTVNHEMGHTQYQMSYRNQVDVHKKKFLDLIFFNSTHSLQQSYLFRDGANPGYHEGVADIVSLAVSTVSYYQHLGLLGKEVDPTDHETNINALFTTALQRLAFLPAGYVVDKIRWDLYSGLVDPDNMNCHWTKLRLDLQGKYFFLQKNVFLSNSVLCQHISH